jgi:hypothetical protein
VEATNCDRWLTVRREALWCWSTRERHGWDTRAFPRARRQIQHCPFYCGRMWGAWWGGTRCDDALPCLPTLMAKRALATNDTRTPTHRSEGWAVLHGHQLVDERRLVHCISSSIPRLEFLCRGWPNSRRGGATLVGARRHSCKRHCPQNLRLTVLLRLMSLFRIISNVQMKSMKTNSMTAQSLFWVLVGFWVRWPRWEAVGLGRWRWPRLPWRSFTMRWERRSTSHSKSPAAGTSARCVRVLCGVCV